MELPHRRGSVAPRSSAACRDGLLFSLRLEEVLGHPYPLVPDEKVEEFRANIVRAKQGEPLTGLETRRQKKDGTRIDVSIWTAPFGDGGAMVVIADVSERKRAEEALRESEERYHHLVDRLPDALFVHIDRKVAFANPAAARQTSSWVF